MRVVADVVVIGAGVTGCSIAFHLARFKGTRVVVVEKGSVASGMTKRSGGMVRVNYGWEAEARLAQASLRFFQNWKDEVGGSCGFTRTGFAYLSGGGSDLAPQRERVDMLRRMGALVDLLSPDDLHAQQPGWRVDGDTWAMFEPEAGYIDPILTTQSLAKRARDLGVAFHTGTFAKSIVVDRGRVAGVDTNTGMIEALSVVVAAGPWTDRLLKPIRVQIGIETQKTLVAFFERPAEIKTGHAAFMDATTGAFCRPHTFGLTLAGLDTWEPAAAANPDQFDEGVAPAFVRQVQEQIATRFPAMANARYIRGHAGIYDNTRDGHAVLDRVPGTYGLAVAAGFSGSGSALAPAVGACMAELVVEGASSTVDLTPFSLARLSEHGNG